MTDSIALRRTLATTNTVESALSVTRQETTTRHLAIRPDLRVGQAFQPDIPKSQAGKPDLQRCRCRPCAARVLAMCRVGDRKRSV